MMMQFQDWLLIWDACEVLYDGELDLANILISGAGHPMRGSGVRPHSHDAHRKRRLGLHDRAHQLDLVIELPALRRGQLAQRLDGDGELPTGALLVPHSTDHAINEHHWVVAGLARRAKSAGRGRTWGQSLARLPCADERVEVGQQ